jgi:hypothetical protein
MEERPATNGEAGGSSPSTDAVSWSCPRGSDGRATPSEGVGRRFDSYRGRVSFVRRSVAQWKRARFGTEKSWVRPPPLRFGDLHASSPGWWNWVGWPWEALRSRGEAPLRSGTSQSQHSGRQLRRLAAERPSLSRAKRPFRYGHSAASTPAGNWKTPWSQKPAASRSWGFESLSRQLPSTHLEGELVRDQPGLLNRGHSRGCGVRDLLLPFLEAEPAMAPGLPRKQCGPARVWGS